MARESAADPQFAKIYTSMKTFQAQNAEWHSLGYLPRDWKWANEPAAK